MASENEQSLKLNQLVSQLEGKVRDTKNELTETQN